MKATLAQPAETWVPHAEASKPLQTPCSAAPSAPGGTQQKQEGWGLAPPGEPEDEPPTAAGGTA